MLEYLRIQDLALIENAELEFSSGINVLTGETGAGKSFILKALNFLTGEKLESDLVRPGKEKAQAEGVFVMPDGKELLIRRELTAESGRSRLFINDRLSSQEAVRELRPQLLLHTSQHGQQRLLQPAFQSKILDDFMTRPDLLQARDDCLKELAAFEARRSELEARLHDLQDKKDLLEFQKQEIDKVRPRTGEEDELELQRRALKDTEEIVSSVEASLASLYGGEDGPGVLAELGVLEKAVRHLAGMDDEFTDDIESVEEAYQALSDLASRLRRRSGVKKQTQGLEAIESRLFELSQLKRKLRRSLPEIVALKSEIEENLSFLDSCALDLKQLAREEDKVCDTLAAVLVELNAARKEAAVQLRNLLENELRELGFSPEVQVEFQFSLKALHKRRKDCFEERAQILWRPNPGQAAQPLDRIASGGELSRFLLALVSLLTRRSAEQPTLIFDEVDAGVGGLTLNKVADKLQELGRTRQMLLITHWPMLAAKADRHFFIRKDVIEGETYTRCMPLDEKGVMAELERMAGGGEQGRALARELVAAAGK